MNLCWQQFSYLDLHLYDKTLALSVQKIMYVSIPNHLAQWYFFTLSGYILQGMMDL